MSDDRIPVRASGVVWVRTTDGFFQMTPGEMMEYEIKDGVVQLDKPVDGSESS
jgi:hypothetical protein